MLLTPYAISVTPGCLGSHAKLWIVWACSWSHPSLGCSSAPRHPLRPHSRLPQPRASTTPQEGFQATRRGQCALHQLCCPALPGVFTDRPGCTLPGQGAVLPPLSFRSVWTIGPCTMSCMHQVAHAHRDLAHEGAPTV